MIVAVGAEGSDVALWVWSLSAGLTLITPQGHLPGIIESMVRVELVAEADASLTVEVRLPASFRPGPLQVTVTQQTGAETGSDEVRSAAEQRARWKLPSPIPGLKWDPDIILDREGLCED